jgi:PAS domain S-box-containing protein
MRDEDKTKHQLMNELVTVRQRIQELECLEAKWKQEKEAAQKSEQKWEALTNSASDGFIILDAELNLVHVSTTAWFYRLGITKENMVGKSITELVPDTRKTDIHDRYAELVRTGGPASIETLVSRPKLGGVRLDADVAVKAVRRGEGLFIIATDLN